jgi:hypothetical protein
MRATVNVIRRSGHSRNFQVRSISDPHSRNSHPFRFFLGFVAHFFPPVSLEDCGCVEGDWVAGGCGAGIFRCAPLCKSSLVGTFANSLSL